MKPQWNMAIDNLMGLTERHQLELWFELLMTEEERHAIAGRLRVFQLLLAAEKSQRQIAAELGVSIATITRCSNYLKHMPPQMRMQISQLILERER
ncbi:trp operon repressor [Shewanella sp. NIFS-20-20]|uniref:trp operon repressor n=1 Tax=Shewanella sp. NIFS-20-20 TaxID=2853806 RepID=UPI001C4854AA|nr:trp operon repressor [Shewanella sp. NIFS-20-20]MBV7314206.1 trp operon repressor [Shewanella sp. NIFS-20-20]